MEEFEASNGTAAETLAKEFAKEKNDIICGFLKEKEIIEMMHREEMNDLVVKFEEEKEYLRHEFELEKEDLLQGFQTQQVEKRNEFQREREKIEAKQAKDYQSFERTLEMKYKDEKLKMRQEYEEVIAEKNEEIKMLRRELLRVQHQGEGLPRSSPDVDIYIKRIEHEDELRRASKNFEIEKLELERKCDREKAEIVQVFANQAERMNATFHEEKQTIEQDHQKELEFKLEVTERLLSEKTDLERKRMIQQFEREIAELKESLEIAFKERLLEKQEAIDQLEKEKQALLSALHTERFGLAQVYNREISLLTNPDRVTKEDVEVALIDEIAKLKQEHDNALIEMEGQHKQKIEVIKRRQQPTKELEFKHRKEIEKLKKEFEQEKESLEAEFRKEQFNLLKSFEFERNDLEQRYEEIVNEKELEIQQKEEDMRLMYEGELDELKSIVEKQREELEVSKQKLGDLAGEMEEFVSEKSRIEERLHKENNQSQNLEQTIDKNLRTYETNLKETEALHQQEISKKEKEFTRERNELKKRLENGNLDLQKENETLKLKLEEIQLAAERAFVTNSENILESDLVENSASDEKRSPVMGEEKSESVGKKSPLQEKEGEKGLVDEKERVERLLQNKEGKEEGRVQSNTMDDVNEFLQKIKEKLRNCILDEETKDTLKDLQMCNKRMKDAINQTIVEIDNLCASKDEHEAVSLGDEPPKFSFEDQILALEDILKESDSRGKSEKSGKDQLNEKLKTIFRNAHRSHEVEKLKLKKEHREELNKLLKEVADEKRARVQDSLETLRCLQQLDPSGNQLQYYDVLKRPTEDKGTSTDDLDHTKDDSIPKETTRTGRENHAHTPSDIEEQLRREKEDMRRSVDELEKSFMREKEELMEKLKTQHKEFVMSADGEIIENLLKQKSALEEAFNLERFYLSRLYYLEMKEELEDVLCRKKEKMKRDFERDKMDIVLKYESEIADLHSLLSEKGEMELRLLQDRNDTMRKLLASQKRKSPERGGKAGDKRNKKERLEREKEKLEVKIPLKKEIAELQKKRQQEHGAAVANLKEAVDLIKDIMSSPPSFSQEDDQQLDRYSFVSEDPVTSSVYSPEDKTSERSMKPAKQLLLSKDEICSKDELKAALETLIEQVLNDDEDSVYDSETTSGASSDLESDDSGPTTVNGESDEGAYSGPESSNGDTLHIKKAELDFAFNLERFNLGRVYYGEYRDSLRKATKKLARAKDSLRNKRKDLENDMLSGIQELVERTQFGDKHRPVSTQGTEAQTPEGEQAVITDHEDRTEDDIDGKQLTETSKDDDGTANKSRNGGVLEDSHGDRTGDKGEVSRGQKGEEEDASTDPLAKENILAGEEHANGTNLEPGIKVRGESFEKPAKQNNGKIQSDEKQQTKEPILAETENLGETDGESSEPEIEVCDPSDEKPLNQKPEKPMEERGETFQRNEDGDEDVSERQKIREEEIKPEIKAKVATLEEPFTKCSERPTEEGDSIQEYEHSENVHSEEQLANVDILAEEKVEDHVYGTKQDGTVSAEKKNKDRDVTEVEAVEDRKGLDTKYEVREKGGQFVTGKEEELHKPLDEGKWVASDHEGECRELGKTNQDDESEDHAAGLEDESELSDANEFEMKIEPSHVLPKEGAIFENSNTPELDRLSERSDNQCQTTDEEIDNLTHQGSTWPVSDHDLIKQLNKNNKILQDKFNLLREVVGKGFVDEIPELSDKKDKEEHVAALESLNDLYAEKENLTDQLKDVDSQMKELSAAGDENLKDLHKRLDDEEMRLLHSLGEIGKSLKMNDDEKLTEHLLKEKEDVCTKLDEINNLLNEQKEAMVELGSRDAQTVPRLMCKKDVLKDDLCEKERQLSYKVKMLEKTTTESGKEKEKLKNSLNSLTAQLAALEDGLRESEIAAYPTKSNKELPPETGSIVKSKKDAEKQRAKLEREIRRAESDIGRYGRILEEQRNRLKPFKRKRKRIHDSLDSANSAASNEGEQVSKQSEDDLRDGDETSDKGITEAKLVDQDNVSDTDDVESERHGVIEAKIEELDFVISNLTLPRELEKEIVEGIPVADILGIVNRVKTHSEEDLNCLEEKILQEQDKLREAGFIHPTKLIEDLEDKENLTKEIDQLNDYQPKADGFRNEEYIPFVKQLGNLMSKKESLEEKISKLNSEISNEQRNFTDARQLQSTGNVNAESESNIKGLLETKERLVMDLHVANNNILQSLSTGGLQGAQSEFIEECVERKVKLEDEIEKLQDKIDGETVRAAEVLEDLLEQKCAISEELRKARESAIEEAKRLQMEVSCNADIPEEMNEVVSQALLTLEPETTSAGLPEGQELRQRQREMEEIIKEKAESLREAKRLEQDPDKVEGALEQVIREKIPIDEELQKTSEDENESKGTRFPLSFAKRVIEADKPEHDSSKDGITFDKLIAENKLGDKSNEEPLKDDKCGTATREKDDTNKGSEQSEENLDEKRRELQDNLGHIENRLNNMLQTSRPSDELEKYDLEKLKSLVAKKASLKENLRQTELLQELLKKKETLLQKQLCGKDAWKDHWKGKRNLETELKKLNGLIGRREREMLEMEAKKADEEKRLSKLHNDKETLDGKIRTLKENIDGERRVVEASLEELKTTMSEQEKFSSEEEQALKQELQVLQDEFELCSKEAEEVEKELNAFKKESRQGKDSIPGDVLNLENLLVEKENLREYLAEIDVTLDNSQTDAIEQAVPTNIEELRKQKKDVEIKMEEIREERTKLDVEFEDEEMDEVMKELARLKIELEERKREVSDQIRGSGVVGKLAEKRKKRESKMPRYYIEGILDEMARDEKTLTELIKEHEGLKAASQRQREHLEGMVHLVKSKVGEDLFNALTSHGPEDPQPDGGYGYRPGIDEVQYNEVTISDILNDISAENEELRHMNGEISSDLETLKEKIGDELVEALLQKNRPEKKMEFRDVIVAVQDNEETLASLLQKQKGEMDLIRDMLGKDLLCSVLMTEDTLDTSNHVDSALKLMAPTIMKKYDEDLEHVIAVYEKELDNRSQENDLLKEKLGKGLSRALLQMSKPPEPDVGIHNIEQDPHSPSSTQDRNADSHKVQFEGKPLSTAVRNSDNSPPFVEGCVLPFPESSDSPSTLAESGDTGSETERTEKESIGSHDVPKLEEIEIKELERQQNQQMEDIEDFHVADTLPGQGNIPSMKQSSLEARLNNIVESYFRSPVEKRASHVSDIEEGLAKGSLKAPTIMRHNGNTLEEVIAQYENDLERPANEREGGDSPRRDETSDLEIPDDIPEEDETMQGILKAQEKNREMLRLLKERLGEDLVYALISETEEDTHLNGSATDDVTANEGEKYLIKSDIGGIVELKEDDKMKAQERSLLAQRSEPVKECTSPEAEEKEDLSNEFSPRTKPAIIIDNESDSGQRNLPEEDTANKRTLKAPSIAIENKTTLADVIASYENGLDSLQSKLGPSLTNSLLSMENPTIGESEARDDRVRETPRTELEEEAPREKEQGKGEDKDNDKKNDSQVTNCQGKTPELVSVEETYSAKELRAPDIMATSGKTLEEVIEEYEERINEELNNLEKEVSLLKEKLGNDLFHTLLLHPDTEGETPQTEEIMNRQYSKGTDPRSFSMVDEVSAADDLKAKSLLRDDGNTVENILRKYERQLEELAKLVPNENNEGISILDLTSNYEDKIADLKNENQAFADRLENLSEIIGPDLLNKLENMDDEHSRETNEGTHTVVEDGLKLPETMQKEGKSLEKVVRNYEKELDVLREMLPNQGEENYSISDLIKDYEENIDDLENRNKSLQKERDSIVNRIGSDLVGDIETLMLDDRESDGDNIHESDGNLLTQEATSTSKGEGRLNAPEIMRRDDSTLEDVLETYEKALGLLPRQPAPQDDGFVENKIRTFDGLIRENKILKEALGDSVATDLIAKAEKATPLISGDENPMLYLQGTSKEVGEAGELNGWSEENNTLVANPAENMKQPSEQEPKDDMAICIDASKLETKDLVRDAEETIENILKNYEKELEATRKLVPSETSEGVPVPDLAKEYEDRIEELENEKNSLLEILNNLENNIGPGLMNEMRNFNSGNKESGSDRLEGMKPIDLNAPMLMENENKKLEGVIKRYENELDALRKLVPQQGEEADTISDIIKGYEDRLEDLAHKNKILNAELCELQEKIGPGLVIDLKNLAVDKAEETANVSETDKNGNTSANNESGSDRLDGKKPFDLNAPILMENENKTLEDVIKRYENELYAHRKLVPHQGEEPGKISDIIKDYEDRLEDLTDKNQILNDELCGLEEKIGHGLVTDLKNLAVGKAEVTEGVSETDKNGTATESVIETSEKENENSSVMNMKRTLKAPEIMNETKLPLEDIVATYEQDLYNVERENKVYKDGLGQGLALALMELARDKGNYSPKEFEPYDLPGIPKLNEELPDKQGEQNQETNSKHTKQPLQNDVEDVASGDPATRPDELKAMNILREEGKDLGKILKNYEKELEALRQLTPSKTEDDMSISDLIDSYENRFEILESDNKLLTKKLGNLVETIGQDLYDALDNCHLKGKEGDAKDVPSDKEIGIEVVNVMKNDDETLENVVKNYEKELIVLRKLVPVEQGESGSISDVIKEYEDKLEELQRRNEDLSKNLDRLEEKIGSNLLKNLNQSYPEGEDVGSATDDVGSQQKVKQSETQARSGTPELKTEKELTLEYTMSSQEKDLKDLTKGNKALKDGLGPKLTKILLNVAEEKEMPPLKDLDTQSHESNTQVNVEPMASTLPKKGKGHKKQRIGKESMEDLTKVYAQPFDQINTDETEVTTASTLGDLKAESLITDEGQTIEHILKNYEKEFETLTQLIPSNDGSSISDVIAKYVDSIESLENEKLLLVSRLDNIEQKIGPKLLSAVENGEPMVDLRLKDDEDHGDECTLLAPDIMQTEERTLENVVKTYEKELDALRSLLPDDGKGRSINDMVKAYEDKLDQRSAENESLRSDSERLVKRIGPNLANDIQKLEEITNDIFEGANQSEGKSDSETENLVKDLKVTKIMDVKKSTLEEVLETYENALGILLSDSSCTMDGLNSENFIDDCTGTIEELKQENDILKNSLGATLSQRLLDIAKGDKVANQRRSYENEETAEISGGETDGDFEARESVNVTKHSPLENSQKDAMSNSLSSPGELRAESLVTEEGRTIENILKHYETELEALKSLVSIDSEQPIDPILSLMKKHQDEIDVLKKDKDNMTERLEFLESKIGPDLMNDMEKQKCLDPKDNKEVLEGVRSKLRAPSIMEEENRTLEAVINCYEKELDVLRKLVPSQEDGQQVSISNIIKDYEDKLDELKDKTNVLLSHYDTLTDRLGSNLVNDIQRLSEGDIEREASFKDENEAKGEMKTAGTQLNAPNLMQENNSTLESILQIYEETLGLKFDSTDSPSENTEIAKVTDNQLQTFKELQEEHKIFKSTLGEKLARNILKMAKVKEREALVHDGFSMQGTDSVHHDTFSELATEWMPFDSEVSTPRDDLRANALMRDKGSTVEDVLKHYEKEIEALSKLIPNETELGYSISDLVRDYEEKIEGFKTESCSLRSRLENLAQKIGQDLVIDLESPPSVKERDEDDLKATEVVQKECKTLEEIVRNYEKELDALRKIAAEQGENPYTIADMVQDYQDKVDGLKTENESLKNKFGALKQRIGPDLIEDVTSIKSDVTKDDSNEDEEAQMFNYQSNLEAPRIMQEKNVPLEDVLQSYETALSTAPGDEVMSKVRHILDDKTIENLERENKVLKDTLGDRLAQRLLEVNKVKDLPGSKQSDDFKSPTPELARDTGTGKTAGKTEYPTPEVLESELKATALILDEGRTIEGVLRNYERDLEALSRIDRKEAETTLSDIAEYGDESLELSSKKGKQDAVADRVGDPMTSASGRESRHSYEDIELLKQKVGSDLVNELLLLNETNSGTKRRWEAVEKMKEEEKTLADILDTYEQELERLKREKNAMEVLVNDSEGDDQSALDIISQYEDEIEHLKDKNKELEARLSVLIARIGDNLVNNVLSIKCQQTTTPRSSLKAVEIMGKEEKQLSAIIEQYENDISKLTRENEILNAFASNESVGGKPLTSLVSEYERKIQELIDDKHKIEADLRVLSEKVGGSLVSAILRPGENEETSSLDALQIMENKRKTLAEVTEQYETDLARMKREISTLKDFVSEDSEKSSFMDRISKYEDEISELNNKIQEQALLEKKVGIDLSRQLTALDKNVTERLQNVTFKATEILDKDKEKTLAGVLKDYEEELEKNEHEIMTLKELVSGDILEIATSQESEIDELKKVKAILANEVDLISEKVGRQLTDEIMKRPHQLPKPEVKQFYLEIVERMETEGKSLADILEEYEKEIRLMPGRNEELSNSHTFAEVFEKIGKDLLNELLKGDLPEGSQTDTKPLFQALELMSMEEKTLGEVIVKYEKELEKLKRENRALRLLTEKENSQDNSVLDILSDYEEKIENLTEENREFKTRLQKISERVGPELTNELLKLSDEQGEASAEPVNELQALKTLNEGQTTLAHVLQTYERRLREGEEDDLGPLVSGKPITEDVKYAELVRVSESEPKITVSEDEPLEKRRCLQGDVLNEISSDLYRPVDSKEISPADQEKIKNLVDVNTTLRNKVETLSRKVGRELAEELMRSPDDNEDEFKGAVKFSSVWDVDAFDDVMAGRATLAQVLESYEKQLEQTLQNGKADPGEPLVESRILKEDIKRAQLLRANEYELTALTMPSDQCSVEENTCDINEEEVVSHYKLPGADSNLVQDEENAAARNTNVERNETDGRIVPVDLDLKALEDLIWDKPQIVTRPEEPFKDQEIVQEEIIRVEIAMREEHFNSEYMEELFGSEIPLVTKEDQCEEPDSRWAELYWNENTPEASESDNYELQSLKNKVKELEKELEEETHLKEKYEKDVEDLLQDIVDLKMKQVADDDDQTPEDTRNRIKEEIELKQDNKRLQDDLTKEKKRRLSIEESKKDLLDEVDSLMREKEMLLKQHNDAKDNEKLLEDMINLRKKLGELGTENKHLNKEVLELKEALSEVVVNHDDEKNKLLVDCEKEKSQMMEELMASKLELETQLQELLGMNDDLKGTIKNLQEELKESSEKLSMEGETPTENESIGAEINNNEETTIFLVQKLKLLEKEANENERNLLYEREKNKKLKEQLDGTENVMKQTLTKYQDEIKSIETEKAKQEYELRKEIEILANKLQLEKESAEQQRKDLENIVQRERERLKGDLETEHEREKKNLRHEFEDKEEELSRQGRKRSADLKDQEEQWTKEREELQAIFRAEKEKLQKAFDDELNRKITENDEQHKQRNEDKEMEMNQKFAKEKMEIKAIIEKKIYEQLLDKNITAETDFQEVLSTILQEHTKEIEGVENDIREAEEKFKEDKNKLIEQNDSEKGALKKLHEEEKKALESTIQNLLREVVKLKQQRKEIRMIHKKEKETMEEIYERDRIKLKDDWEHYKRDLLGKLQEDFDRKLASETTKLETRLEETKQQLGKSEQRSKELEERLKENAIDSERASGFEGAKGDKIDKDDERRARELKAVRKSLEEEYENKLKKEKRKFEETLQGLRREIGNLQEKRRLIQDKIYNQDPTLVDRNLIEKSIANYKAEILSKMEEEVTQKIAREKKPLEETIKEQQIEIDDLKKQRWELRNQIRRERSKLEEEFDLERERLENQFLREKEELKNKLDTRLQREMTKRAMEDKVNRALSPISNVSTEFCL